MIDVSDSERDAPSESGHVRGSDESAQPVAGLVFRAGLGGGLMGLANLVPGISGGTMLLATGIYPRFVSAIAQLTRLQFRKSSLVVLFSVVGAAGVTILVWAGLVKSWVLEYPWVMYSLFIGLTLGGVPVLWSMIRRMNAAAAVCTAIGFALMVLLVVGQMQGWVGNSTGGPVMLFAAGLAGASAMILPGISGGYLLLLLGQYVPILGAIEECKDALSGGDIAGLLIPVVQVVLPVGLGVVTGVVAVGNLLEWLLNRYRKATLGFLLGLLVGSIAALYPFRRPEPPQPGQWIKGQVVTVENQDQFEPEDWPHQFYRPTLGQSLGSLGLIALGFATTWGIDRWGRQFRTAGTDKASPDGNDREQSS